MLKHRSFILGLIICGFAASTFSSAIAQTLRRRIARQDFKRVEVYIDGGSYLLGLDYLDDLTNEGAEHLIWAIPGLDSTGLLVNPTVSGHNKYAHGQKTFGGGVNFNINPTIGVGIKFLFNQHYANSVYYAENLGVAVPVEELGGLLLVDIVQTFQVDYKYNVAPIIVDGYYRFKPMPEFGNLTFTGGAGIGLYTTTMEIFHHYNIAQDAYSIYVNLPDQFLDYTTHKVVQPIGGYIFGGVDLQGSSVISVFFNAEYHLVPDVTFKEEDWDSRSDLWYYPSVLDYAYGLNLAQAYEQYNPREISLSGLRLTGGLKFSF